MKKLFKNRAGFTLIEMLVVVAIVVILASVLLISAIGYLSKANIAKSDVLNHNSNVLGASKDIESQANS